jgi:hypothetical protein
LLIRYAFAGVVRGPVALAGVGLKLLETVDGIGVEMPPAPAVDRYGVFLQAAYRFT